MCVCVLGGGGGGGGNCCLNQVIATAAPPVRTYDRGQRSGEILLPGPVLEQVSEVAS